MLAPDPTLIAGVGGFSFLFVQNVKRYRWFRNEWGLPASILVSVIVVALGLLAAGKIAHGDWLAIYNSLLDAVTAGLAAPAGYRVQKPLRIFEPAPDSDQAGTPYGPAPTPVVPTPPSPSQDIKA